MRALLASLFLLRLSVAYAYGPYASNVVRVGNTAHVSGQADPWAVECRPRGCEDLASQLLVVFRKIDEALASVGLNKHHIVKSEGILSNIGDLDQLNFLYNQWLSGVEILPVMTVWEGAALSSRDGAALLTVRVEIAVVASSLPKFGSNGTQGNYGPYTSAVASGDDVYLSGMQGEGDSFEEQLEGALNNIDVALATLGLTKQHLVFGEAIVSNVDVLPTLNTIYNRWLSGVDVLPAMIVHEPSNLCLNAKVEITVMASRLQKFGTNGTNYNEPPASFPLPYTLVVGVGDKGYLSGKISYTGSTLPLQLADVLLGLEQMLSLGGFTKNDIVQSRVVLANLEDLETFSIMYRDWFSVSGVTRLPAIMVHQPAHVCCSRNNARQVQIVFELARSKKNLLV